MLKRKSNGLLFLPGKGGAYLQAELRNLRDGTKLNERFRSSETVERARLEQKPFQYLYADGDLLTFMDSKTYEQIFLNRDLIGDQAVFLQDGMEVSVEFFEEEALDIALPEHVALQITEADAVVKGQTASSSYKPALLENGVRPLPCGRVAGLHRGQQRPAARHRFGPRRGRRRRPVGRHLSRTGPLP